MQKPHHLGVIIDGNRRWAREKGLPTLEGHRKGLEALKSLIKQVKSKGIKILTIYVFSTDNWNRSKEEVSYLMNLFKEVFKSGREMAQEDNIKMRIVGESNLAPKPIIEIIKRINNETTNNDGMIVNFAFSYNGRKEIIHGIKEIINKGIPIEEIDEKVVSENLYVKDDIDLIIRTGKEKRLSGFLTWQSIYSEFYFLDKYWPDFNEDDLDKILNNYANRQRRFGK